MLIAYTIFNVYFPKLVELRLGKEAIGGSRTKVLWDVVVFTLGGTPGAIVRNFLYSTCSSLIGCFRLARGWLRLTWDVENPSH